MLLVQHPAQVPLHAQSEPSMRACPVHPLVGVPVVRGGVDALALVPFQQLVLVPHPHAAADDLADARHEQVHALGEHGVLRALLHVEGLEGGGESAHEDGLADHVGHGALRELRDIVSELEVGFGVLVLVDVVLAAELNRVRVVHALERAFGRREGRVEQLQQIGVLLHHSLRNIAHHVLDDVEQVLERDEGHLGLQVGELREVTPCAALLRAERGQKAEAVADGRDARLQVQLRGLGQVRLLAVVVELEQG
mmetsp:Transcript_956/g.1718  ORF Transcript_956/g.1718 Transcript_956/m.1718 type:complete len:252 (+) Transcript_956:488-1243(+)